MPHIILFVSRIMVFYAPTGLIILFSSVSLVFLNPLTFFCVAIYRPTDFVVTTKESQVQFWLIVTSNIRSKCVWYWMFSITMTHSQLDQQRRDIHTNGTHTNKIIVATHRHSYKLHKITRGIFTPQEEGKTWKHNERCSQKKRSFNEWTTKLKTLKSFFFIFKIFCWHIYNLL
jgi:hypothetical protein